MIDNIKIGRINKNKLEMGIYNNTIIVYYNNNHFIFTKDIPLVDVIDKIKMVA